VSEYTSSNPTGSYSSINRKTLLAASGSSIEAATKQGSGQVAYATNTSAGKKQDVFYNLSPNNDNWIPHIASVFHCPDFGFFNPLSGTTHALNCEGMFNVTGTTGSLSLDSLSTTHGRAVIYTTGAGAGNQAGFRQDGNRYTMRKFGPFIRFKFRFNETTNIRVFLGLIDSLSLVANSDDPLNAISGIGLGKLTTSGNYLILRNDSAGATQTTDTGIAVDTNPHVIDLYADDNQSRWYWAFDYTTASGFLTTDIPAQTTGLSFQVTYTTTTAVARSIALYQGTFISIPQ
jgi:hypothetical protein